MKNQKRHPAMLLPGNPELLYWPKVPLEIEGEVLVPDFLVRLRSGARVDWAMVEVDEGGFVTQESLERERRLGLPTLRVTEVDILRADFVDHLVRRLQLVRVHLAVVVVVVVIVIRHREQPLLRRPPHRHWAAPVFPGWPHRASVRPCRRRVRRARRGNRKHAS